MVFVQGKGAADWDLPTYDPKSKYLTLILHFGGTFQNTPSTLYIGGQKIVYDWVRADEIRMSDLDEWSTNAGVKGEKKFQLKMMDYNFKLCIDDSDLRNWARKFLSQGREMHIFVEELDVGDKNDLFLVDPDYESYEDSDFVIGNELNSDNDDDVIFDEEVEVNEFQGHYTCMSLEGEEIIDDVRGEGRTGDVRGKGKVVASESSDSESDHETDVLEGDAHDFDEYRVSDEDNDEPMYPVFNPKTTFNPDFEIGQIFATKKEFKRAAQSDAVKKRRNIHFPKNDTRRIYAKCLDPTCKWMIHTLVRKNEHSFQIRKFYPKHTCAPSQKVKSCTSSWLSERFLQRFQSDGKRKVSVFLADATHDIKCEISRQQAHRAKSLALLRIDGDPDSQYAKLWSYAEEIRKTNPGSTIAVGTEKIDGATRFSKIYMCFEAMKKGFSVGCRLIIGVDGCHLKSKYGGVLLSAVGVDGNNNLYPIAYAVVDRETGDNWAWFFSFLKADLKLRSEDITFISDKQKGLIQALDSVFPGVDHRFCVRHMHNNLKAAGFTGLMYKQAMWKAACSTTEGEFKIRMDELKALNEHAWCWFADKPGKQWSKAYFDEKSKCDMLLNNVCESFNSAILDARDKAIITMLEWIREYLMKRLQKHRDAAKKWKGRLCPRISKILEKTMDNVAGCIPIKSSDIYYQISCLGEGQYSVNLEQRKCSCNLWQLTGIPCKHGMCAIIKQQLDPSDFVDDFYTVNKYLKAYENPIYPISYEALWGDTLYIPPLPPTFGLRPKRGRRLTKRRLGADEIGNKKAKPGERMRRQQKTLSCRTCGEEGHNSATCKMKQNDGDGRTCGVVSGGGSKTSRKKSVESGKKRAVSGEPSGGKRTSVEKADKVTRSDTRSSRNSENDELLPPRMRLVDEDYEEDGLSGGIATQQSQITCESWLIPNPVPQFEGPTMHQQLQMGNLLLQQFPQPRVNIRAPPPSTYGAGHFTSRSNTTLQAENSRMIFEEGGQKFMSLISQTNVGVGDKKVKKKVGS